MRVVGGGHNIRTVRNSPHIVKLRGSMPMGFKEFFEKLFSIIKYELTEFMLNCIFIRISFFKSYFIIIFPKYVYHI